MDELVKSFKTIALMGKPRRDINLQMHEKLVSMAERARVSSFSGKKTLVKKFGLPEEGFSDS